MCQVFHFEVYTLLTRVKVKLTYPRYWKYCVPLHQDLGWRNGRETPIQGPKFES